MTSELKSMFGENYSNIASILNQNTQKDLDRKKKEYIKKQTGLKRELYKILEYLPLIDNPNKKIKNTTNWIWSKFINPLRNDKLQLEHWQRKEDIGKEYDKLNNKSLEIIEFTKDEYDKLIKPNDINWNYEQTMYLWNLIKQYNLKFIIIYDRFDEITYGKRTIESLKDRYYSIAKIILEHRKLYDHPIIKSGYNYEQEIKRRNYLEKTMNKSFAELKEENYLMELAENLNKKMEKNENFEKALKQKLNELPTISNNQNNLMNIEEGGDNIQEKMNVEPFGETNNGQTFEEFIKNNITRNDSFIYLRSQKLKRNLPVSEKIQERVDNYMKEFNIPQKLIPTAKVEMAYDNLRNNVILYTTLKKYLDKKEKELAFLQKQYQDYQTKKNPQGNPNPIPIQPHQALRSLPKNDKNINQHKLPIARPLPSDIKEMELPLNSQNKNNLNRNNQNIQEINNIISNEVSNGNNIINQTNNDLKNNSTNVSVVNNTNEQQDNKQGGHKEKKKRITGTPKAKKRKNANEDDIIDEEKEQKSNSKKKKKGTK